MITKLLTIIFITCHAGPAEHFAPFAEFLNQKGYHVRIYASGPALSKVEGKAEVIPFSSEEEGAAFRLAEACKQADIVMTDVGHPFALEVHKALMIHAPGVKRWAYYDNPEPYVPGGYSELAELVMQKAHKVLFANANLATQADIGLGYYPLEKGAKIAERRKVEKETLRTRLLKEHGIADTGQKIGVYIGGNHPVYFTHAFPAFLNMVKRVPDHWEIWLQSHPGARDQTSDAPTLHSSSWPIDDMLVAADAVFYYQTSMAPLFVLAGIPVMQVGHQIYHDILVKNGICSTATDPASFAAGLATLQLSEGREMIFRNLGLRPDWQDVLMAALKE